MRRASAQLFLMAEAEATYALHLWPCAPILAQFLLSNKPLVTGKNVLELGAGGTGLPGLTAKKCGASRVIFSDNNERAFSLLRKNGVENNAELLRLEWGDLEAAMKVPPVDVILASDCFFDPKVFSDLIATLAFLIHKNSSGDRNCVCYFSYQERNPDWTIEDLLSHWDLRCELIPATEYHKACISCPGFDEEINRHTILVGKISSVPV